MGIAKPALSWKAAKGRTARCAVTVSVRVVRVVRVDPLTAKHSSQYTMKKIGGFQLRFPLYPAETHLYGCQKQTYADVNTEPEKPKRKIYET